MSALPKRKDEKHSATWWAEAALSEVDGNVERAKAMLSDWFDTREDVRLVIKEYGIAAAIRQARHQKASGIAQVFNPDRAPSTIGLLRMAERHAEDLLQMPIFGGLALGDCTSEDIDNAIKGYLAQAKGNIRMTKFLGLVKKSLGNAKFVRDRLRHEDLVKLQIETDKV